MKASILTHIWDFHSSICRLIIPIPILDPHSTSSSMICIFTRPICFFLLSNRFTRWRLDLVADLQSPLGVRSFRTSPGKLSIEKVYSDLFLYMYFSGNMFWQVLWYGKSENVKKWSFDPVCWYPPGVS